MCVCLCVGVRLARSSMKVKIIGKTDNGERKMLLKRSARPQVRTQLVFKNFDVHVTRNKEVVSMKIAQTSVSRYLGTSPSISR